MLSFSGDDWTFLPLVLPCVLIQCWNNTDVLSWDSQECADVAAENKQLISASANMHKTAFHFIFTIISVIMNSLGVREHSQDNIKCSLFRYSHTFCVLPPSEQLCISIPFEYYMFLKKFVPDKHTVLLILLGKSLFQIRSRECSILE